MNARQPSQSVSGSLRQENIYYTKRGGKNRVEKRTRSTYYFVVETHFCAVFTAAWFWP